MESLLAGKRLRERLQPRFQERPWDRGCGRLISRCPYEDDAVLERRSLYMISRCTRAILAAL